MENVTVQLAKPKTTPKDFFLWLFAMVALYISVGSFLRLLFQYINAAFPDALDYGFDPYSATIRFAIASLLVFFPLYFYLTSMIQGDLRKFTEKRELGIRKWLIFFTLFVAGMTLAGDLVALLYTFLGGEITTRFVLKAGAIFLVIGTVFWYYIKDLKGVWIEKAGMSKMTGIVAGLVMLGCVVGGFFIMGSPTAQRQYRLDSDRASDLSTIQSQIVYSYWQTKGELPKTLDDLSDDISYFTVPTDPETNAPYTYKMTGPMSFELCATFSRASRDTGTSRPVYGDMNESWTHEAGEQCFARTIDPDKYPVRKGSDMVVPKPIQTN